LADHKIGMMVLSFMDYLFLILFLEFLMFYFYQVVSPNKAFTEALNVEIE